MALAASAGCGLNMQKNYDRIRPQLLAHNYDGAASYVESVKESFYDKNNRLLYYMDRGMTLYMAKRYEESNHALEQAKNAAEELWTESISANAAAWVTTDNALPYQGEDFEKVLIHFVTALNHMGLGALADARVEARQIGEDLALYNSKYETKNVYSDDAFSRWMAGRLAETEAGAEANNDAWIDYRRALEVYEKDYAKRYNTAVPRLLVTDALRALTALGPDFADELAQLKARYPSIPPPSTKPKPGMGRLVFLHLNGEAPFKVDQFWTARVPDGVVRVAYPRFVARPHAIAYATVKARESGSAAQTELMENITAIAIENLHDHMGRIQGKAIARAVAKHVAGTALEVAGSRKGGEAGASMALAGALWNLGSALAEEADKRSWVTLPSSVHVSELMVPMGHHTLDVSFHAANGAVIETASLEADVRAGETAFLSYRTFR